MPDAPSVSLFTRYVLENPWPLGILLVVAAAGLLWLGLRDGVVGRMQVAAALVVAAAGVITGGVLVVTPGEHGQLTIEDLVHRVATRDVTGAEAMLTDDATYALGSLESPGFGYDAILVQLSRSLDEDLSSARITSIEGYGLEDGSAQVHFSVVIDNEWGRIPSNWVAIVVPNDDGSWSVKRVVWISVLNGQKPKLP